ncbi:F-box domain-containing protein [Apiospora kogelbergensis]|uniref:F-box domain-containing protein n=1 Tax=Apiospora kogelbergensis TaxID=1337665 RepID=A0AAW0QUV7_9PEZI
MPPQQDGSVVSTASTFILPIGASKSPEQIDAEILKTADKRRLPFKFRNIIPLRTSTEHDQRRLATENAHKQRAAFDQLFLALPNELKIQIVASLPLSDILSLRLASRSWHAMISLNELPIVRYHLKHHIPAYATRLYPVPEDRSAVNIHYLCGIWHRLHVAAKLAFLICEWITKELFLRRTEEQRRGFSVQRERMRRRLIPLLFTLFHFFETYRALHLQYIEEHGHGLMKEPYTVNPIEAKIMSMYDDKTLLHVHQVFPMVVSSFCRRLRPPSYVGRVEGALRGYMHGKPSDEIYVTSLCIGGLRQCERFWEIKGYNSRRGTVDAWYNSVAKNPATKIPAEPAAKPRRGLLGLSRKKSSFNIKDAAAPGTEASPPLPDTRARRTSDAARRPSDATSPLPNATMLESLVFDTSMSAGMPMGPLSREQLRLIIPDLPVLQQIWMQTAEALILDRKIVERPQDIKRNAAVMLDLIQEDGAAVQDEWWYGRVAPESVCPPLESIDEDPIE